MTFWSFIYWGKQFKPRQDDGLAGDLCEALSEEAVAVASDFENKVRRHAEGEKNFFARVADNQITFETGPEGRATSLILHRAGQTHAPAARLT
jgi:hypothetical protein